ncbi:MAG: hypothetical protein M0Z36_04865 [Thermaerobacter sp.]|nr:hypothetical protein [Thermaerobacter sp.]
MAHTVWAEAEANGIDNQRVQGGMALRRACDNGRTFIARQARMPQSGIHEPLMGVSPRGAGIQVRLGRQWLQYPGQ